VIDVRYRSQVIDLSVAVSRTAHVALVTTAFDGRSMLHATRAPLLVERS
jgi:hypothetical protein